MLPSLGFQADLPAKHAKTMQIVIDGKLRNGVYAKDIILAIIGKIGVAGGVGYVLEIVVKSYSHGVATPQKMISFLCGNTYTNP